MQDSIISWTQKTWNAISGCSRVSDGCKYCYAAALSARYGWTTKPWTIQNEAENVVMKPHKLKEPYLLKEPTRIFVNSMSDMFHEAVPDWYRAAMFCVMLDLPQHTFQILTKRSDMTVDWDTRFVKACQSDEFMRFANEVTDKRVKQALIKGLTGVFTNPWRDHIWQGVSVEDKRVIYRIADLQKAKAKVRFISAEPLIGDWPEHVDLTGIHWIIVGGESGNHMTADNPRWMKQEWARHIRDLCVSQGTAYFYKQDSGIRTEMRPFLVEEDGSQWTWQQYPGNLVPATEVGTGKLWVSHVIKQYNGYTSYTLPDHEWGHSEVFTMMEKPEFEEIIEKFEDAKVELPPKPEPPKKTTLVNVHEGRWNVALRTHSNPDLIYIGRTNPTNGLAQSKWANPFKIEHDTPEERAEAVAKYRIYITGRIAKGELDIEELRGKVLACWCSPKLCHGDVLLELLGEKEPSQTQQQEVTPQQPSLFDLGSVTIKHYS